MIKKSSSKQTPSAPKVTVDKDSSVQVRQIKNGFIVSESGTKGSGRNKQWYNDEYFSKTNPLKIGGSNGGNIKFGKK